MIVCIALIELQVRWNRLKGPNSVTSSGQRAPLVDGTLSIIRAITLVVIKICEYIPIQIDHIEIYLRYVCANQCSNAEHKANVGSQQRHRDSVDSLNEVT